MICKKCEEDKPVEDFYKSKNTKSGYRGSCKFCINKQNAEWYANNAEEFNATTRKTYRDNHKEDSTERMRRWRAANPERAAENARRSYERNRKKVLERSKRNHASKPGYAAWKRARRQQRLDGAGTFTISELTELFEVFENKCINPDCDGLDDKLSVDHVVPLSKGGGNTIENIQPLCLTCNLRKGTKVIDYRESYFLE